MNNVCLLLFNNHYYPLTSLSAWYGQHHYCIECEVRYNSKHTCKPIIKRSKCSEKNCQLLPTFTRCCKTCFGAFRNSTCFRNPLSKGVCDNAKSCDTCGQWFIVPMLDHVCIISYCSYCSKSVKPNHRCFIEVKKRSIVRSCSYVFYDFEYTKTRLTLKQNDPFTKLIIVLL